MINDEIYTLLVLLAALLMLVINFYVILYGLSRSAFSTLYWLSLGAVFSVPLCFDLILGLPYQAFLGRVGYLMPYASRGMMPATIFAFGHVATTAIVYMGIVKIFNAYENHQPYNLLQTSSWLMNSHHVMSIFGVVFMVSSAVAIYQRFDLTRAFNDFLDSTTAPAYETYFFFASTPLIAILWAKRKHYYKLSIGVACISVIVAYFLGVRYYMFPFIGYLMWMKVLEESKTLLKKLQMMLLYGTVAWIALTVWGVIRGLDLRGNPLALISESSLFTYVYGYSLTEQLFLGNEFSTRVGYYDLMARLQMLERFRGVDSLVASAMSAIYPFILRVINIPLPISNAKLIYELQSGVIGSGVSSGTTVFGSDWFAWGWWGIPIGGVMMGTLLASGDLFFFRRGTWWMLIGPMWAYQLIFFARGGTDVWLGLWGRFLPLSLIFLVVARVLDSWRVKTVLVSRWQRSTSVTNSVLGY